MPASALAPYLPNDEFTDVARQLEGILLELSQVSDAELRRSLLATMRLLIGEADRLAGGAQSDPDEAES